MYFQAFGWLITTFVTVFGVMIALMTYNAGVKNNNNSNYTSHLTMFREFASAELTKRSSIYPEKVNFLDGIGLCSLKRKAVIYLFREII